MGRKMDNDQGIGIMNHPKSFVPVDHPQVEEHECFCPGFRLEKVPIRAGRAPCLAEHNEHVCTKILELSDEDFVNSLTF